jgi:hypothetical protein
LTTEQEEQIMDVPINAIPEVASDVPEESIDNESGEQAKDGETSNMALDATEATNPELLVNDSGPIAESKIENFETAEELSVANEGPRLSALTPITTFATFKATNQTVKMSRNMGSQTNPLPFGPPTTSHYLLGEVRPWGAKAECLPMKGLGMYQPKAPAKLKPITLITS